MEQDAGRLFDATWRHPQSGAWTSWVDRPLDKLSGRYEWYNSAFGRGTWQASPRNKFNMLIDYQRACNCYGSTSGLAQEASGASYKFQPSRLIQATWSSPRTSRLLMEAGAAFNISQWNAFWEPSPDFPSTISVNDVGLGIRYGLSSTYRGNPNYTNRLSQRFSTTYVTGTHTFKVGFQNDVLSTDAQFITNGNVNYTFRNADPISITLLTPYLRHDRGNEFGVYAQEKWTLRRLTVGAGVRFDTYDWLGTPTSRRRVIRRRGRVRRITTNGSVNEASFNSGERCPQLERHQSAF